MKNVNINALVKLLGINPHTLRGWERRYNAVTPRRNDDGDRSYSAKDIERIRLLMRLVQSGHSIGKLAPLSTADLRKLVDQYALPITEESKPTASDRTLEKIIASLEAFDLENLHVELQKAHFNMGVLELMERLIHPLLTRVGQMVVEDRLSISQEHVLSALLRDYLGGIHQSLNPYKLVSRTGNKSILLCTREGDLHEFGILLSAILCNLHRYRSYYLGSNLPGKELAEAVTHFKADAILLGLMKLPPQKEVISSAQFVEKLDRVVPKRVVFILGGSDADLLRGIKTQRKMYFIKDMRQLSDLLSSGF